MIEALDWSLKHSAQEDFIRKQCRDFNLPLPKEIEEKPDIPFHLEFVFEAFHDLNTSRGYIPCVDGPYESYLSWKDIYDWCQIHQLDNIETYEVSVLLKEMDKHYVDYRHKHRKASR